MKSKVMRKRLLALLLCMAMMLTGNISVSADNVNTVSSGDVVTSVEDSASIADPVKTPEATTEPTVIVGESVQPTASPEAAVEPSAEPTASPEAVVEPSAEATASLEEVVEPSAEATASPEAAVEPSAEPTASPESAVEPSAEPTASPESTVEPSAEPTASPGINVDDTVSSNDTVNDTFSSGDTVDNMVGFAVESFSIFTATYDKSQSVESNQRVIEDLYYKGLRQKWDDTKAAIKELKSDLTGTELAGQLASCLDYAKYYDLLEADDPKIEVKVNAEELPDTYFADGLVLGLKGADSTYYVGPQALPHDTAGNDAQTESFISSGCEGAIFKVGDNITGGEIVPVEIARDANGKIKEPFGVRYVNIGTYAGQIIDVEVRVTDYAINVNDEYTEYFSGNNNAVIGLRTGEGAKPGLTVHQVAWVELTYKFYLTKKNVSDEDVSVDVKGNTTYYDIDEFQAVFLDNTCQQIYVTNENLSAGTDPYDIYEHNKCVLNLGWFDTEFDEMFDENNEFTIDTSGFGVYSTETEGVKDSGEYTSRAFTEAFDVPAGIGMTRIFSFQNANYDNPDLPDLKSNDPSGNIFHSGIPVAREGDLNIRKQVAESGDGVRDTETAFRFEMTLLDGTLTGQYGDLYFENGVAYENAEAAGKGEKGFALKHGDDVWISDLPAGTGYRVEEISHDGYSVTVDDNDPNNDHFAVQNYFEGTIAAAVDVTNGFIPTVIFTNKLAVEATKDAHVKDWDERTYDITITASSVDHTTQNATIKDYIDHRFEVDEESVKAAGGVVVREDDGDVYVIWEDQTINPKVDGVPGWSRTITVKAKPEYIGGNDVTTNGSESSIIVGSKDQPLDQPTVNVKVDFEIGNDEHWIYKGDLIDELFTKEIAGAITDIQEPDNWEKEYTNFDDVTKTVQWYNADGNKIGEEEIRQAKLEDDTEYYAEVTISAVSTGDASLENTDDHKVTPVTKRGTYKVHVVKGEIQITKELDTVFSEDKIFTFEVMKDDQSFKTVTVTVTVPAGDTIGTYAPANDADNVLKNLPRGEYVVTEAEPADFILDSVSVGDATECQSKVTITSEKKSASFKLGYDVEGNNIVSGGALVEGAYTFNDDGSVKEIIKGTLGTVTFTNIEKNKLPVYDLPSTGGSGIYWYTISGLIMMLGAALIAHRNKYGDL